MHFGRAILLWAMAACATAQTAPQPVVKIELLRAFDARLPAPTSADVREILTEADRVLRAKLPVNFRIKIVNAGEFSIEKLFEIVDLASLGDDRENPIWRYDFDQGARARNFTDPQAREARLKFVENFSLEELGNIMPGVQPRTHDAYRAALEAEYHKKMAWLAGLKLPAGGPVVQRPLPPYQSAMDWVDLLEAQDRFDIVMTNTLIVWDITHSPPPHSIFHHGKLGGGAMRSNKRQVLGRQAVLLDVFEEYGGIPGICRTDPAVTRSERNRIVGAVLLAHELGHALFALPDVYDHGDKCLMNSSTHNLDQRVAYQLLTADPNPCPKCQPWVRVAVALADARRAAAANDAAAAAPLYEQVLRDMPTRLNRPYETYMKEISTEALPICEKAGLKSAVDRCRTFMK